MTIRINFIGNFALLCAIGYGLLGCGSASLPLNKGDDRAREDTNLPTPDAPSLYQPGKLTPLGGGTVSADAVTQITWGTIVAKVRSSDTGRYTIRLLGRSKECLNEPPSIVVFVAAIDAVDVTKTPIICEPDAAVFTVSTSNPEDGSALPGSFRYMVNLASPPIRK